MTISYGAGNKHVLVACEACDPTGKITVVNRKLEAERVTCPSCRGTKQISIARLPK